MTQQENPVLKCADAGPVSAAFSENRRHITPAAVKWDANRQSHAGKIDRSKPPVVKSPFALRIKKCSRKTQSP